MSSTRTPFLEGDEEVEPKKPSAIGATAKIPHPSAIVEKEPEPEHQTTDIDSLLGMLPPELLQQVFNFMGPRDIATARLVCRQAVSPLPV